MVNVLGIGGIIGGRFATIRRMALMIRVDPAPLRVDAHGAVRVGNTRVTLDTIIAGFKRGATAEELAQQYSAVSLEEVYAAISYYLSHRDEVEAYLGERRKQAFLLRQRIETEFDPQGIRDRLLARRAARDST